ncbi:Inosine-uridine nucleoside N-ribohydrolase [Cribrihabitans marinus]|uniref:Inosine-uridine nucleoside N-ribohydrolase n=2 Tax=Cribrihabitans marinus TaxID=1227549 RepID=A0A1H6QZ34_9RHOB|nr:nucleoside hydrolase [Cribrihabitans marinus]SEI48859.1 Inosine-uridine nucleoside N-ribohydrolase [Cribrihabitans marinus]
MKLIIDTDPGIDDALAIAYAAAAPEIELLGLSTVFGNTQVHQSSRNARYVLHLLGLDVPVAEGAALPRGASDYHPSVAVHGAEGFGHVTEIPQIGQNHPESAAEFLVRMAREHAGELIVCAIGPLTNIADAMRLDPGFAGNLNRLVIMGGSVFNGGNVTAAAEANIYHDPVAADEVLAAGAEVTLVGLDVTLGTLYDAGDFDLLSGAAPKVGGFLREISQFYLEFYRNSVGIEGCGLHDSTAVIACTHPQLFDTVQTGLHVAQDGDEIGATRMDSSRPDVAVCRTVAAREVIDLFTQRVASLH